MNEFKKDKLTVKVMASRTEMGKVAAQDIHDRILALLAEKDEINMIFAAAPSQAVVSVYGFRGDRTRISMGFRG